MPIIATGTTENETMIGSTIFVTNIEIVVTINNNTPLDATYEY